MNPNYFEIPVHESTNGFLMNQMLCLLKDGVLTGECLDTILSTMAEGVFIADTSRTIVYVNPGAERIAGIPSAEMVGRCICDILPCSCSPNSRCVLFDQSDLESRPCNIIQPDGTERHVIRNARLILRDKKPSGIVETLTDITDLKKTEERLARLETAKEIKKGITELSDGAPCCRIFIP